MNPTPPKINSTNINRYEDFFAKASAKNNASPTSDFNDNEPQPPQKPKRRGLKITLAIIILIIFGLGGFVVVRATSLADKIFVGSNQSLYSRISDLFSAGSGSKLIGEKDGQVNVLMLGIGGPGHDGPYLTDTMIVAQLKPKEEKATLISIPRDYLVNTKEFGQGRINAVFAQTFQKTKDWNQAGQATIDVVEKMSGLTIPYFAVIDFDGFEKTIDLLGGVEVQIDRTFTDYTFPNNTGGYIPAVTFTEGIEQMNGERALIFARSRHAAGPEGSDFARGVRQQKIIQAAKTKLVALNLIADARKINELFTIVGDHFHTNMTPGEMLRLYALTKDYESQNIISLSLDPTTGLICPRILEESGAFVLTTCAGKNAQSIIDFFQDSFDGGAIMSEKAVVWLADSTVSQKLYKTAETELAEAGLTVYKVIYTGKPLQQNIVYAINQKPATLNLIKDRMKASEVSLAPPGIKIDPAKVDMIIILGSND
ncbi:MAG TPA: LCP family protein [Candidatus Doudnabacteria bacterium]|mgnify:CR=1 FL=1|nr:LCP family protein [Candidatus Doudnabacteria bacterium]